MIIRIMGEGQWEVPDSDLSIFNEIDGQVEHAVTTGSQTELTAALSQLVATVKAHGRPIADEEITDSDLIIPDEAATVEEVSHLLAENASGEGLIPG